MQHDVIAGGQGGESKFQAEKQKCEHVIWPGMRYGFAGNMLLDSKLNVAQAPGAGRVKVTVTRNGGGWFSNTFCSRYGRVGVRGYSISP